MLFSESDSVWFEKIPVWAEYLIKFGYDCSNKKNGRKRFSLISMPCDSPGAGLVALGAMRYFLDTTHFYSNENIHLRLENGDYRPLYCGSDRFKYIGEDHGKAVIEEVIRPNKRRNPQQFRGEKKITRSFNDLRFENEPILVSSKMALSYLSIYEKLVPAGSAINVGNLQQSHSAVCLAARKQGSNITKDMLLHTRFKEGCMEACLHELLSLVDGSLDVVSRVSMYNTRTAKMDRQGQPPEIVVADGIDAFLKITEEMQRSSNNDFSECNIVAIIDRTEKREKLDSLLVKALELRQWYEPDTQEFSAPPKGIALATYVRST